MQLYTIHEIGHRDETTCVRLPRTGKTNEIALCQCTPSEPALRGTGHGWEEISHDEARRLMGWS